jgi:hypothetical protein
VCVAVLAVLVGCGSGDSSAPEQVGLDPLPTIRSYDDIVLPLDSYRGSKTDRVIMETAREELTAECMESLGYSGYPVSDLRAQALVPTHGNTFGIVSEEDARTHGFAPSWAAALEQESAETVERFAEWPGGAELSGTTPQGSSPVSQSPMASTPGGIPPGGCLEEGRRKLFALGGGEPPEQFWFDMLEGKAFVAATEDPRMVPVTEAFARCIRARGYDFDDPASMADDDRYYVPPGEEFTAAARDAALAAVACKHESRYTDTLVALTAAFQEDVIEENAEALTRYREVRDEIMAAIREQGLGTLGGREGGTPPG